jgi:DNA-binding MarR family transcriptional regulator
MTSTEVGTVTALDQVLELTMLLQEDMTRWFEPEGLTEARAHLLWLLQAGPSTQKALADQLRVSPRNVTGLVDGLVATGHVQRQTHPTDRRATLVVLTRRGKRVLSAMVAGYAELQEALFGDLSPRQLASFQRTIGEVTVRLRSLMGES